jgi:hypothetical protein
VDRRQQMTSPQPIAATPSGHLTLLASHYGKPYTVEGSANAGANGRQRQGCRIARHTGCARRHKGGEERRRVS